MITERLSDLVSDRRIAATVCAMCVVGVVFVTSAGCEKDEKKLTWEETDRPPSVEQNKKNAAKLQAPPMFASIPADTPYVFAAFEPIPYSYWKHVCDEMCPAAEKFLGHLAELTDRMGIGAEAGLVKAVISELRGNMSAEGLRKLGFSTDPVFAVYGLGPLPVARIQIGDAKALAATIARVEGKAGLKLPTKKLGSQEYWLATIGHVRIAIAIVGKELVVTGGPERAVERALPILFGQEKLAKTMADGAALKKLAGEYGFASYGLGYIDLARLVDQLTGDPAAGLHAQMFSFYGYGGSAGGAAAEAGDAETEAEADATRKKMVRPRLSNEAIRLLAQTESNSTLDDALSGEARGGLRTPTCRAELQNLAGTLPRVVMGYDEVSAKRAVFSAMVETDAATAKRLEGLQTTVPGLSTRLYGKPLFAMGGAVDLTQAGELLESMGGALERVGRECGFDEWVDMGESLSGPFDTSLLAMLPEFVSRIRGGVFVLQSMGMSGAMPKDIRGYAVLGLQDPGAALAELNSFGGGGLKADGKFHSIPMGPAAEILDSLKLAAKSDALVFAAGSGSEKLVGRVMAQKGGKSPLFIVAYDVGNATKLMRQSLSAVGGAAGAEMEAMQGLSLAQEKLFGLAVMWIEPTDRGLRLVGRADIR